MKFHAYIVLTMILAGAGRADTINWPDNNGWIPLFTQSGTLTDATQDTGNNGHPHLDIVGDETHASGYLLFRRAADTPGETEDQLLLRIRLNGQKNKMKGAWQVFFETDGDVGVEWVLQLTSDNLASDGKLQFGTSGGITRDGIEFGSIGWTGSYAGNVHWTGEATGDGSQFGGDEDYFLDFSIPWNEFSALTGVDGDSTPYRLMIATSQQGGQMADNGVENALTVPFSDFSSVSEYSIVIPEPVASSLLVSSGIAFVLGRRIFKLA